MADPEYLTVPHLDRTTITRIFSKIVIDNSSGCWNWTAAVNTYGYGQIWYLGRDALSHRLLYAWLVEPLQRGHGSDVPQIDHICNNRRCCNPAHLRVVTAQFNVTRTPLSVSGRHFNKTHCKRGHLLPTERNRSDGRGRTCLICREITRRDYYERVVRVKNGHGRKLTFASDEERNAHRKRQAKAYREANKERLREYFRAWQRSHR